LIQLQYLLRGAIMRGCIEALWVDVKSWLISTGSVPQLACLALLPLVVASILGTRENQAFLSAITPPSYLPDGGPISQPALTELWLASRAHIGAVVGSPQEAQPETVVFADMHLRHESIFPFDRFDRSNDQVTRVNDGATLDQTTVGSLSPASPPGSIPARTSANALIDRALTFDQNGFVSETLARRALGLWPESPRAKLVLGRILANHEDPSGLEMLLEAADHDPRMVAQVRATIEAFAQRHILSPSAQRLHETIENWAKVADLAIEERNTFAARVQLLPGDLDDESVVQIRSCIHADEPINTVQLVRKSIARWVQLPAYFVVVDAGAETQRNALASCIGSLNLDATVAVVSAPPANTETWQLITERGVVLYQRKS
jgi:hypothetical protein